MSVRHRTQFDIAQTRLATPPSVTAMTTEQTTTTGPTTGPAARRLRNDPALFISDLLPMIDFVCIFFATSISTVLWFEWAPTRGLVQGIEDGVARAALFGSVLAPFILYNKRFGITASHGLFSALVRSHALRFSILVTVLLALGVLGETLAELPAGWLVAWGASGLIMTSLVRVLAASHLLQLQQQGGLAEVVAVVGTGPLAQKLVHELGLARPHRIELLGVFDDRMVTTRHGAIQPAGTVEQLIELGKARRIDWIVMTLPAEAPGRLLSTVQRLQILSVPIGLCPQHVGAAAPRRRIDYIGESVPMDLLCERPIERWSAVLKGAEDVVLGALITILLLPLLAAIALAIRLDGPGPILFRQRRHAVDNREFHIYKFRTMRSAPASTGAGLQQTSRNDTRVTRVGRFLREWSLDELPQLFNVLEGSMSLVGPRPHATNMRTESRLGEEITAVYAHRHRVKPGITGWAQVNGARGATDTEAQLRRRVDLDLYYIENWSLLLDLKILLMTAGVVAKRTNAF